MCYTVVLLTKFTSFLSSHECFHLRVFNFLEVPFVHNFSTHTCITQLLHCSVLIYCHLVLLGVFMNNKFFSWLVDYISSGLRKSGHSGRGWATPRPLLSSDDEQRETDVSRRRRRYSWPRHVTCYSWRVRYRRATCQRTFPLRSRAVTSRRTLQILDTARTTHVDIGRALPVHRLRQCHRFCVHWEYMG